MTIYLLTGTPGSGKSLYMARELYWHVRQGRPTICNFDLNRDLFKDSSSFTLRENDELTPEFLIDYSREYFSTHRFREDCIRLYIDECQLLFNARDWNSANRRGWIKFFTQHRKLGYEIKLISQFDTMIDKQVRALIEYEYKIRKLNNIGWVGKMATLFAVGHPVCIAVKYWYPMKERLGSEWFVGRKRIYRLYDTQKIFG